MPMGEAEVEILKIVSEALDMSNYCILPEKRDCPFVDHEAPVSDDTEACTGCQYLAS